MITNEEINMPSEEERLQIQNVGNCGYDKNVKMLHGRTERQKKEKDKRS